MENSIHKSNSKKDFNTDRLSSLNQILKTVIRTVIIICTPIIIDLVYPNDIINDTYKYFSIVLIAIPIFREMGYDRIKIISFDITNKALIITVKPFLYPLEEEKIYFENLKIEIDQFKPISNKFKTTTELYFLNGKREVGKLTEYKDGFNQNTIKEIIQQAQIFSIPIISI